MLSLNKIFKTQPVILIALDKNSFFPHNFEGVSGQKQHLRRKVW